jgi:hypothetical protein
MRLGPFGPGLRPRERPALFALDPFILPDLFFDQVGNAVEGVSVHHRREPPRAPRFPEFGALDHALEIFRRQRAKNDFLQGSLIDASPARFLPRLEMVHKFLI